jgi:hypothetical protein
MAAIVVTGNCPDMVFVPVTLDIISGVGAEQQIPTEFSLSQNFPNPFNPSCVIRYGLPQSARVTLTLYNLLGQRVAVVDEGMREAGYHDVSVSAADLPSGIYFYRLQAGSFAETRKMVLLK